jgi:hypothetical protein
VPVSKNWQLLSIFVFGILLLFGAGWVSHFALPLGQDFAAGLGYGLEHLGVVLVVAMLLRATLEAKAQLEFVNLVNEQVRKQIAASTREVEESSIKPLDEHIQKLTKGLTYTISSLFDEPLQKELEKSVFNPKFSRPEYTLRLKLSPLTGAKDAHSDLLEVILDTSYQVKNVAKDAAEYTITFWIDDVIQSASNQCRFTRVAYGDHEHPHGVDIDELKKNKEIVTEDGVLSLKLKAGSVKPGTSVYVDIQAVQLMRTRDHFVWNLAGLTQKLNIIVELLDGLTFDNFNVYPREMHHLDHAAFLQTAQRPDNHTLKMQIDQVLLPFQGVEIRWFPRSAPGQPA